MQGNSDYRSTQTIQLRAGYFTIFKSNEPLWINEFRGPLLLLLSGLKIMCTAQLALTIISKVAVQNVPYIIIIYIIIIIITITQTRTRIAKGIFSEHK